MTDPLTPAQIAMLEDLIEDRQQRLLHEVEGKIADAVADAVKYGDKITLRMHEGQLLCAAEGGPSESNEVVELESRPSVEPWESFTAERGQA